MNATTIELFHRFVAAIPSGPQGCIYAELAQPFDPSVTSKTPFSTVLIKGRHDGSDAPLCLVLMAAPAFSADDAAVLDFAVRRARANKAPYFVTWTLRDAMLWQTPKPGIPAGRDAIQKLRDYPDVFEVAAADHGPLTEPVKLEVLKLGGSILYDLERLLKDEALELVRIDATYFVGRLLDAVHHLLPLVSSSLQTRMEADVALRNELGG